MLPAAREIGQGKKRARASARRALTTGLIPAGGSLPFKRSERHKPRPECRLVFAPFVIVAGGRIVSPRLRHAIVVNLEVTHVPIHKADHVPRIVVGSMGVPIDIENRTMG